MNGIYGYYDKEKKYVVYIGQDGNIDINKRHKDHLESGRYNQQKINSVLQNNPNRYDYFILAEGNFSQKELDDMERQAIDIFKTYRYDYPERSVFNFTKGGDFSPSKILEIAEKISKANSGKNHPMYGKHHTEGTRRKISKAVSGENNPMYGKSGENNPNYGKKLSEETKRKMSENHADVSGKNHPMYGKTGKNSPRYKNYVRIIKYGYANKKQQYAIIKDGRGIKYSINKEKLKKWFKEQYPDEKLVDETT